MFNAIENDEIHFLCYCPKYLKLRNESFVQIKSHLHNFQQLSYRDLAIKMINSMICILIYDWRLIPHYWIICLQRILSQYTLVSCKKMPLDSVFVMNIIIIIFRFIFVLILHNFGNTVNNYSHANKCYCCCSLTKSMRVTSRYFEMKLIKIGG